MGDSAEFRPGDMVELEGPAGSATGEVVSVAADLVTVRLTGDVSGLTPEDLEEEMSAPVDETTPAV